ncbi:MAG: hypothetical protein U5L07_01005 [Desulfobacterales bacterium]|nr:hypothetical protein [Desulfobacterales bacterium]
MSKFTEGLIFYGDDVKIGRFPEETRFIYPNPLRACPWRSTGPLTSPMSQFPKHLRWFAISGLKKPEWVAEKALKAFEKQKFLYVPGFRSWLIHILLLRLSPKRMVDWFSPIFLRGKD